MPVKCIKNMKWNEWLVINIWKRKNFWENLMDGRWQFNINSVAYTLQHCTLWYKMAATATIFGIITFKWASTGDDNSRFKWIRLIVSEYQRGPINADGAKRFNTTADWTGNFLFLVFYRLNHVFRILNCILS